MPERARLFRGRLLTLQGPARSRRGAEMSELGAIEDGALLEREGQIAWVGEQSRLSEAGLEAGEGVEEIDLDGGLLMPGLVDCHTHLVWGGSRKDELELRLRGADYEEIFAAGGGILSSVRQTQGASEAELESQSRVRLRRMIRSGTTAFEIKSGYGLELASEEKQLRVAASLARSEDVLVHRTCLAAHALPESARGSEEGRRAFVESVVEDVLPRVVQQGLADSADVFCDRGAFRPDESLRVLKAAQVLGLRLRVHANEFGHTGGARVAAEVRADSADHLLHLNDEERAALAASGTTAVLLPGTSTVLGKGFADGRALVEAGVPVAVASDCNPGSCAFENLSLVLALACYGCRLSPQEAIVATTHNAAASLGWADRCGRLAPGLRADLLWLDTDDPRDLVYHAGSPFVREVFVRGQAQLSLQR